MLFCCRLVFAVIVVAIVVAVVVALVVTLVVGFVVALVVGFVVDIVVVVGFIVSCQRCSCQHSMPHCVVWSPYAQLEKIDCAAAQRRLLLTGPPVNLRDKAIFKADGFEDVGCPELWLRRLCFRKRGWGGGSEKNITPTKQIVRRTGFGRA